MKSTEDYATIEAIQQQELILPLESFLDRVDTENLIPVIDNFSQQAKRQQSQAIAKAMQLNRTPVSVPSSDEGGTEKTCSTESAVVIVRVEDTRPATYAKLLLKSEADVDDYLGKLREKYLQLLKENKKIQV